MFSKYKIEKTDGTPVDPNAKYFVFRYDGNHNNERAAILTYAKNLIVFPNAPDDCKLGWQIINELSALENAADVNSSNLKLLNAKENPSSKIVHENLD